MSTMLILHSTGKFYFIRDCVKIFLKIFLKAPKKNAFPASIYRKKKHFFFGVSKNFRKWFTSPVVRISNGLRVMWMTVSEDCMFSNYGHKWVWTWGIESIKSTHLWKPSHKHWPWYGLWSCFSWTLRFCENRLDLESNHNYLVWTFNRHYVLTVVWR